MKHIAQALVALLMLAPLTVAAQTQVMNVTYTWTAPTTGSPVDHYEFEVSSNGGSSWILAASPTTPSATVSLGVNLTWIARVRAVDSTGRKGIYSQNSDPYIPDPGPPGACGKPQRIP